MGTKHGDVALLNDPVAQKLLQSTIPARVAYNWKDGSPRVIPIWFHWNGKEIVIVSPPGAPKLDVLEDNSKVAITIDSTEWPYMVLYIRGTAKLEIVEGIAPEYVKAAIRYLGEEAGNGFVEQVRGLTDSTVRIVITPEWVGVLDFETRFPSAVEKAMAGGG
jgi:hypothetical protein